MTRIHKAFNLLMCFLIVFPGSAPVIPATNSLPSENLLQTQEVQIFFLMDTSESMDDDFDALCVNINSLVTELQTRGINLNYRILGLNETRVCAQEYVSSQYSNGITNHYEDWGPSIRDVASLAAWTPGSVRLIVPVSDEAPQDGGTTCDQADEDSITQAITASNANSVRVSPILGEGYPPCVEDLAQRIAQSTGGAVFYSNTPAEDMAQSILDLIGKVAADRDGDGIPDDDDPFPDDACRPDRQRVCLPQQVCGISNTPHWDDDNDGSTDEETMDGIDNDNDGLIDEDVGGVNCPYPDQDCGVNSHRGFDDDDDNQIDEEQDDGLDNDGDNFVDEDVICACPVQQDAFSITSGIDDDLDFMVDEELPNQIDDDFDGCIDEDVGEPLPEGVITIGSETFTNEELITEKQDLIEFLSDPISDQRWLPFLPYFSGHEIYAEEEAQVQDFVDVIAVNDLTPAEMEALAKLVIQERGLKGLWLMHVRLSNIFGRNVGNVIVIILGVIDMFDFLNRPDFNSPKVRGYVTKVVNKVTAKLMSAMLNAFEWVINKFGHPDGPSQEFIRSAIIAIRIAAENKFNQDLGVAEIFAQGALQLASMKIFDYAYMSRTEDLISTGLISAKDISTGQVSFESALNRVNQADSAAAIVLEQPETETAIVVDEDEQVAQDQEVLKIITDMGDAATVFLLFPGIGQVIGTIGQIVSTAMRLIDSFLSGWLVGESAYAWFRLEGFAEELTNVIFFGQGSGRTPIDWLVSLDAPQISPIADHVMEPQVSYLTVTNARLAQSMNEYSQILNEIRVAVENGDRDRVGLLLDELIEADDAFSAELQSGRLPAWASADEVDLQNDEIWNTAYLDLAIDTNHHTMNGVLTYLYILGYLLEAEGTIEEDLLASLDALETSTHEVVNSTTEILPLTEGYIFEPLVSITQVKYPDDIGKGATLTVDLSVTNAVELNATGVELELVPEYGMELISAEVVSLGTLNGFDTQQASFTIKMTETSSIATIDVIVTNGQGFDYHLDLIGPDEPISSGGEAGAAPSGFGGLGLGLIIVLIVVGGGVLFVYSNKRKKQTEIEPSVATLLFPDGNSISLHDNFLIGRGSQVHLKLEGNRISRRHALIRSGDGAWFIQDQGSQAGTFVNGVRVQATRLNNGDRISIGAYSFIFRI